MNMLHSRIITTTTAINEPVANVDEYYIIDYVTHMTADIPLVEAASV